MTPERWRLITAVFHDALARDPQERGSYLDQACAGDPSLRGEVDRLLAADEGATGFGERPAYAPSEVPEATGSRAPLSREAASPAKRHPFTWFAALAAFVSLLLFGDALAKIVREGATRPDLGWRADASGGEWRIADVNPSGPAASGLRPGDRFLGLNGVPPRGPEGIWFHRRALSSGTRYVVTVERDGEPREVGLVVGAAPEPLAPRVVYLLVSLVWCGVGLAIGLARPNDPIARLGCLAALATGHVFLDVGVLDRGLNLAPLHGVLGFHFFSRFPGGPLPGRAWRIALGLLYLMGGPRALVSLLMGLTLLTRGVAEASRFGGLLDALWPMGLVAFLGAILGMLAVIPYKYRGLTDPDLRRRVRWVAYGSAVALSPNLAWLLAAFTAEGGPGPLLSLFTNASSVAMPICMAYAVVKHRVLDIRVVVRRGLQYLLARRALQAAVVLPLAVVAQAVVVNRHRTIAELATENRGYLFWVGVAGVSLRFRKPLRGWLDRRFFAEDYDREHLLLGLLDDVGKVDSISDLGRLVTSRLGSALHPKAMYIWYRDPGEREAASSSNPLLTPPDLPAGARWLAWLEGRARTVALPAPPEAGLSREEARWFAEREVTLAVPIMDEADRLAGALFLGEKKSEEPYGPNDRRLLQAIARQTAVVRENLRLRARVHEDARVRHDVLARLGGRLPDLLKECPACGRCFDGGSDRCPDDGQGLTLTLPVTRTLDGKYRLDRLIGKGGMGAVYEAGDLRLGRSVAVKILLGRQFGQQAAIRRFRREARAAAALDHPNIVAVHDFGTLEGEGAFLVMELVRGVTLRAEIERSKTLSPALAAAWFEPLLDGLAAAHAQGVVHRDLKPENVMGDRRGTDLGSLKILDLGLAKIGPGDAGSSKSLTAEGVVMGTIAYMSPEQLLGREVDHRTDLYAVGVMLIEALTGHHPFRGDTDALRARAMPEAALHVSGSTEPARALALLLERCLAFHPQDRWPSASALRAELRAILSRAKAPLDLKVAFSR